MSLEHDIWRRRKLSRHVTNKASCIQKLRAYTFPDREGYCEYTFNWPIKISIDGQQCNGLDKRPTDYNFSHWSLLIDGQLRFIHWIAISILEDFLKDWRLETSQKGVSLNWMNGRYIQHSFDERKFSWSV